MKEDEEEVGHSFAVRAARWMLRVSPDFHGAKFFARVDGVLFATPLFMALVVVDIAAWLATTASESIPNALPLSMLFERSQSYWNGVLLLLTFLALITLILKVYLEHKTRRELAEAAAAVADQAAPQ